jgi:hypothetical protein
VPIADDRGSRSVIEECHWSAVTTASPKVVACVLEAALMRATLPPPQLLRVLADVACVLETVLVQASRQLTLAPPPVVLADALEAVLIQALA